MKLRSRWPQDRRRKNFSLPLSRRRGQTTKVPFEWYYSTQSQILPYLSANKIICFDKFESEAKRRRRRFDNKNSFLQVASVLWLEFQLEIIQIIVDWPNLTRRDGKWKKIEKTAKFRNFTDDKWPILNVFHSLTTIPRWEHAIPSDLAS